MATNPKSTSRPKVVVRKIVHADRETVFEALTKPELMNKWFVGGKGRAIVAADVRVGGSYTNEMLIETHGTCSASKDGGGGPGSYKHEGKYLEVTPPERLSFTWNSPYVQNTTVVIELKSVDTGTEVVLTHELNSEEECEGHRGGWTFALDGLATLLG
jgi:uncharacterized protein YndB with AHSA1/START domain